MILKNIIIILFIILFNIIDVENLCCKRRKPKLRVWGRIDCRNRLAKDMRIGLYQFNIFKYPKLLKKVPCRCGKYFDIRAEEISHSRTMPYLAVTYKYIVGRFLCKPRAILKLPKSYDNNPYKFGKSYYMGTINILKMFYEVSNCRRIRWWTKLPKSE